MNWGEVCKYFSRGHSWHPSLPQVVSSIQHYLQRLFLHSPHHQTRSVPPLGDGVTSDEASPPSVSIGRRRANIFSPLARFEHANSGSRRIALGQPDTQRAEGWLEAQTDTAAGASRFMHGGCCCYSSRWGWIANPNHTRHHTHTMLLLHATPWW
jgi:hypothetical protein